LARGIFGTMPKPALQRATAPKRAVSKKPGPRADYGAPVDAFFSKQPPALKAIADALRALVDEAAPGAEASIKWGMPFYCLDGAMLCSIGVHKAHVNLVMVGPPGGFEDPDGHLLGVGRGSRHLKLTRLDELPRAAVRRWLRVAVRYARSKS
jgi:hypothetical protein